jgi:hypothetical protein
LNTYNFWDFFYYYLYEQNMLINNKDGTWFESKITNMVYLFVNFFPKVAKSYTFDYYIIYLYVVLDWKLYKITNNYVAKFCLLNNGMMSTIWILNPST